MVIPGRCGMKQAVRRKVSVIRKWICFLLVLLFACCLSAAQAELKIAFLDVGQGDAIVLMCSGEAVLIDAGPADAGPAVSQYLRENIESGELKAVIATHVHDDHLGGMPAALSGMNVRTVYTSPTIPLLYWFNTIQPVLLQSGLDTVTPARGDTLTVGDAIITFMNTDDPTLTVNNRSTVLRVDYGNTSFLLMGDAEGDEETELLTSELDLRADVLKLGHHGGIGSTGNAFLNAVSPEYAIISVGANNDHGHPAAETLALLETHGIQTC